MGHYYNSILSDYEKCTIVRYSLIFDDPIGFINIDMSGYGNFRMDFIDVIEHCKYFDKALYDFLTTKSKYADLKGKIFDASDDIGFDFEPLILDYFRRSMKAGKIL